MTHKFKPGDKVRIVRKGNDQEMKGRGWTSSMDRFIGTTQTVRSTTTQNDTPGYIIEDGGWDFPECILEKAEELPAKSEMPRFKAGDKVRFISCEPLAHEITGSPFYCEADELKIGEIYTIREVSSRGNYYLEGKKFSHDPRRFEAVSSEPAWKKFKAGDKVRCMHLNDIPGESDCESGRKPYFYLEKGGIYTVYHINVECKQDNADFYIFLVEDNTALHPGRFELVEEKEITEDKPVEKKPIEEKFGFKVGDVVEIKPGREDAYCITTSPWHMTITSFTEKKMYVKMPDEHPEHAGDKYEVNPSDFRLVKKQKLIIVDDPESVPREQHFFAHWIARQEVSNDELLLLL